MTKQEIIDWHKAHPYGARDEAYIDAVLAHVKRGWMERPHQRIGQVIANIVGHHQDVFYIPDEDMVP